MDANFFVWSDDVWLLLDRFGILAGDVTFVAALGGTAWGFLKRERIRRWFTRNRFPNVGADVDDDQRWDGIAFTVSRKEPPIWVIESCRPAHIGLIASTESKSAAEEIARRAREQGIHVHESECLYNPDDPSEAMNRTRLVLSRMREAGAGRIAVDVTGGKTPMSLGAFMAAEEAGVSSLYVSSDFDADLKKPDMRSTRIHCISKPE